jgi:hypothetical protein
LADRANAVTSRDRIVGAIFVLLVVTVQTHWMGRAVILLSVGLVIAYLVWIAARWNNDPVAVLPMCLLAIAVQCVHFCEEFLTGFPRQFPKLLGNDAWSDAQFVAFNMAWLTLFVLAALGVYRRVALAYLVILFLALAGGVGQRPWPSATERHARQVFPRSIHRAIVLAGGDCTAAAIVSKKCARRKRVNVYRPPAFTSSTRAVATGMTASMSTGVRAALFARYKANCASFISTPLSKTWSTILEA